MANVQVDSLRFDFAPGMVAEKYDEWSYYRNVLVPGET